MCEIFLYDIAAGFYIELHITPENQRLQLRLPLGAIEAVRQGKARVEDFMVDDPNWAHTTVECAADSFAVRALIPARNFTKDGALSPSAQLKTAVCRYDYRGAGPEPILSSSAALRAPSFHAPEAWTALVLQR
ncbi:MAG TPA: hypothetical protein VL100_09675 [Croceibacterium sp.]|nr:hypothetical protein [Croceibacterium sp.]